jgi:hypothetical protein
MEPLVLKDQSVIPTDDLIFSVIGENKIYWQKLMEHVGTRYPDAEGHWNYYNDGKSWLFKMVLRKKTLFWIGIHQKNFRTTFYFGDKAEPLIERSDLPESIKNNFKNGKRYGKIRAITMIVNTDADVANILILLAIRATIK